MSCRVAGHPIPQTAGRLHQMPPLSFRLRSLSLRRTPRGRLSPESVDRTGPWGL